MQGKSVVLLVQGRGKMAVMSSVTAVLLHNIFKGTGTEYKVLSSR